MKYIICLLLFSTFSINCNALSLMGRLGIGVSNQFLNGVETVSLKIQRNSTSALGAMVGVESDSDKTLYAAGGKYYRLIYDEPQLNFYSSIMAGAQSYYDTPTQETINGYQIEGALGSEFSLQGLESLGFSFEFGLNYSRYNNQNIFKTFGHNIIRSAIHFYL